MNERDTFKENLVMPNYRVDNSKEIDLPQVKKEIKEESPKIHNTSNSGLSKTKIININDFIFRQYLEFYPELQGLSCKDNTLYLEEQNEIIASETLTFDLRTLPGEAWNVDAKTFMEIISMDSYDGTLTGADGTVRSETWVPSNYYSNGTVDATEGIRVFGGKTGTTDQAGCCVILYSEDLQQKPYISVIMGAEDKNFLYQEMNRLFTAGIEDQG